MSDASARAAREPLLRAPFVRGGGEKGALIPPAFRRPGVAMVCGARAPGVTAAREISLELSEAAKEAAPRAAWR